MMETSYQKYFDTNYVPSMDETHIQTIVDESAKEIADLCVKINTLQEQLDILKDRKEKLKTFSDKHRALLSPVRQLTRDILEQIFLACFPVDRNPCMSATEAPMLLTRICSLWRKIALSTPRIWAKIHIPLPLIQAARENYVTDEDIITAKQQVVRILKLREIAVNEWLSRSHPWPLSISVYQTCTSTHPRLTLFFTIHKELQRLHLSFLRNTIIPHHKRWRDFDIYAANDTLCGTLESGLKAENLEMLETFHVTRHMSFRGHRTFLYQWKDIVSLMPSCITSATLHGFTIQYSDMSSISPHSWGKLTELCLKLDTDRSVFSLNVFPLPASILHHCHALVTLKLIVWSNFRNYSTPDSELQHGTDDIILQYLTTLSISLPLDRAALAFAKRLYLPSIYKLGIDYNTRLDEARSQQLGRDIIKSLLRATDDLSVLTITTPVWASSCDVLVQILECARDVRVLNITAKTIDVDRWPRTHSLFPEASFRTLVDDDLLRALMPTNRSHSDIICPKLEDLIFDNRTTGITEKCLKEFLLARESDQRVPSIRRISVRINKPKQNEDSSASKVVLGSDSAVYFRRKEPSPYSLFDGYKDMSGSPTLLSIPQGNLPSERYNEL